MPTLRQLRLDRLWSQRELAEQAGVAEKTVITIESGRRLPRLVTMRAIADALGVPWHDVDEFRATVEAQASKEAA